ncbi:MAG: hypothetical protein ACLQJR_13000 [Stellaceae bacterium]
MELTRRSRTAKRATLLASTAIIALLGACQGPGSGASSTAPATSSSGDKMSTPAVAGAYFQW